MLVLAIDGTITKDTFNLTIPMAALVDAANHEVLIAREITESANKDE